MTWAARNSSCSSLLEAIFEREKISLLRVTQPGGDDEWLAWKMSGPTALVAAMRAYVASKIGEKVDLP